MISLKVPCRFTKAAWVASVRNELLYYGNLCRLLLKLQNVQKKIVLQKILFIKDVIVVCSYLIY